MTQRIEVRLAPERRFGRSLLVGLRFGVFYAPDRLRLELIPHIHAMLVSALTLFIVAPISILTTLVSFALRTVLILLLALTGRLAFTDSLSQK